MTKQFRLTAKSQVTIPKDVRDALGLKPGDCVTFDRKSGKVMLKKVEVPQIDERARADMRARIERARRHALPMDMTTDEYMATIREPVPLPDRKA